MMKKLFVSVALGAVLMTGVAIAQPGGGAASAPRHSLPGDTNGDGKVTRAELSASLDARFAALDTNHDGKITPEERAAAREKRFDERFAKMDTDGNGQLSKEELKAAHDKGRGPGAGRSGKDGRMGMHGRGMNGPGMDGGRDGTVTRAEFMARPLAMFDKADADKDGVVTAEEAKVAWQAFRTEHGRGRGMHDPDGNMPTPDAK
jgi:hypothetical protein